ncbi:hypothetical protein ABBQ32_012082 [Trebouxia sp. C0010 RCD-2024]
MAQSAAQLVSLASAQFPCARYVDWLQVQGFLDMAESALRAKNAANDRLIHEKTSALQHLSRQTEQIDQVVRQGQAEDTAFLRQQLEALLRERAAAKQRIAGLERENNFLLDEREILFRQLDFEAGNVESNRSLQTLLSARRSDDGLSVMRSEVPYSKRTQVQPLEPVTPVEAARLAPSQDVEGIDSDSNDEHATPMMQEDPCFPAGYVNEPGSVQEQPASKGNAGVTPAHWLGSSRQPLQVRPDHDNAALSLPDYPHRHPSSGETLRQQPLARSGSASTHVQK